jgi:hypothetical protein
MRRYSIYLLLPLFLTGCANYYAPPAGASTSVLEDYISQIDENEGSAMICYAKSIDGVQAKNALIDTRARSTGTGRRLNIYLTDRKVQAGIRTVVLRCEKLYARPIDAMLGKTPSLEGQIEFKFEPSLEYEVRADFNGTDWAIYIRDAKSRVPLAPMVYGTPK